MVDRLKRAWGLLVSGFLLGMVCVLAAGTVVNLLKDHRVPITVHDIGNVGDGVYRVGEPLRLRMKITKHRECKGHLVRIFINTQTGVKIEGRTVSLGTTPPGETKEFYPVIPVPPGVGPGLWLYRSIAEWDCKEGPVVLRQPDVEFSVIP